jgi:hypothetical protein
MSTEKSNRQMNLFNSIKSFIHQPKFSCSKHEIEQLMCQIRSLQGENDVNEGFTLKVSASMTEDVRQRTIGLDINIKK